MNRTYWGRAISPKELEQTLHDLGITEGANEKRPERQAVISQDDILDLKIALGASKSVDEFIKLI